VWSHGSQMGVATAEAATAVVVYCIDLSMVGPHQIVRA
jgi:hypothetical protein